MQQWHLPVPRYQAEKRLRRVLARRHRDLRPVRRLYLFVHGWRLHVHVLMCNEVPGARAAEGSDADRYLCSSPGLSGTPGSSNNCK
jgi:hypothetical protein